MTENNDAPKNEAQNAGGQSQPVTEPCSARRRAWYRGRAQRKLAAAVKAAQTVRDLLELGDHRLLAADGPAGNQLPDLSPKEWGKVYRACKRIAAIRGGSDG